MSNRQIVGSINDRGQPIVSLQIGDNDDPLPALIDTGFNRCLLIFENQAREVGLSTESYDIEQAYDFHGRPVATKCITGSLRWLGERKTIVIHILPGAATRRELAKLGTELLRDCRLSIDFPNRQVHISPAEPEVLEPPAAS